MKSALNIKKLLTAGLCALTISFAMPAARAQGGDRTLGGHTIIRPAFGDGQETHGGPRHRFGGGDGQETHGGPRHRGGGDGQETHGGPR